MKKSSNPVIACLSGSIAGGLEAMITWPNEVIKTELQVQPKVNPLYNGVFDCAQKKIKTQGLISLYRGITPIVLGSFPKAGVRFGGNSFYKKNVFADANGNISRMGIFGAGLMAGASEAVLVVTPLETLKTRLINANKPFISGTINLLKTEGPSGIYKGVIPTICKQSMNQGTRFLVYDSVMNTILSFTNKEQAGLLEAMLGGMCAGIVSVLVNQPVDTIKTRLQSTQAAKYSGVVDCVQQLFRTHGITGFYKGLIPRLGRVVPGQMIIFGSYNTISEKISSSFGTDL